TTLAFDRAGNLIVGTESPGKVFRVDAEGKGFLLLDSPFQEIHALRFDEKGALFVAAISGRPATAGPPVDDRGLDRPIDPMRPAGGGSMPSVSAEITSMSIVDVSGGG